MNTKVKHKLNKQLDAKQKLKLKLYDEIIMDVKYYIGKSKHGKGVFAGESISKGTRIWTYHAHKYIIFDSFESFKKILNGFATNAEKINFLDFTETLNINTVAHNVSDSKYFNHSYDANVACIYLKQESNISDSVRYSLYATRNINKNEELYQNYIIDEVDKGPQWYHKIRKQYNCWEPQATQLQSPAQSHSQCHL